MSFYSIYNQYKDFNFDQFLNDVTDQKITAVLSSDCLSEQQFLGLLSRNAFSCLELIAQRAKKLTCQYFGKTVSLYTPLYLSNYCVNNCPYCGFNLNSKVERVKLSLEQVEEEARFIANTGLKHILLLTGESPKESPVEYIKECVRIVQPFFSSVSIEVYPLSEDEYKDLIECGVDGLTIYQEVYNKQVYEKLHLTGPKKDYLFRLDAPERALKQNIRTVSVGTLLGLYDWRKEIFFAGLHARYLQDKFPESEISISVPRIQKQVNEFKVDSQVSDENLVQIITALRVFLPRVGINVSTREPAQLRDNLLPLGVTRISAGSTTKVGGHTIDDGYEQFSIADTRTVEEIKKMLKSKGYQPVLKDWMAV